ncbi:MAG: class I SAM-dependent methyltransferase [Gammaproteobacteria bacterium]|nr:class I SAM-dependent methyltransferase [Gammaproteobacteria bacterium]
MTSRGIIREITHCRICGNDKLVKYLDLGMMPLANNLADSVAEAKAMQRYPMQVLYCRDCSLSQLSVVIDPRELFSKYAYRSSINRAYLRHCREMAVSVGDSLGLREDDLVVDIAGNDGALLSVFKDELDVRVVNVDPAENLAAIADAAGVPTITSFWGADVARRVVSEYGRPKLITATNVFAHVDNVRDFVAAAKDCLDDDGALMLEFPYGVDFIEHREFDTIYFEHLSYVLLRPVNRLVKTVDMQIFDVQKQNIHGGSVRVFIGKQDAHEARPSVAEFIAKEATDGYHDVAVYENWNNEIRALIDDLVSQISNLRKGGAKIAGFAASAKGNTLLNACQFDSSTIDYIVDDTPEKIGKFSPGTGIPIVDRTVLADDPPDYLVILAWNFAELIIASTSEYSRNGGKYIIPIPDFKIIESGDASE